MLKTPGFWYKTKSCYARTMAAALTPASLIYRAGHRLHHLVTSPRHSALPVICCGNLVAGGAGKTPAALAIYKLIVNQGLASAPVILTRGYGRRDHTLCLVRRRDSDKPDATAIGDEARLLSEYADCIITSDRVHGAQMAEDHGYDCIIMDDGLQHRRLARDFSLCVIDGLGGFGNRRLLPAGPLREPLSSGLRHCDAYVLIGADHHNVTRLLPNDKPCHTAELVPEVHKLDKNIAYIAFCGIGNPDKFRESLENAGVKVDNLYAFADHHVYTAHEIAALRQEANDKGAGLITTDKDMMRLAAIGEETEIETLPVYMEFNNNKDLIENLKKVIQNK
jgi:tetraacyldisaccharide 4'-kinase